MSNTPSPWPRWIGMLIAALLAFAAGWSQGELAATHRLSDALQTVAPGVIQAVRDTCPRELTREAGWSESCLDLLSLTYFFSGEKK